MQRLGERVCRGIVDCRSTASKDLQVLFPMATSLRVGMNLREGLLLLTSDLLRPGHITLLTLTTPRTLAGSALVSGGVVEVHFPERAPEGQPGRREQLLPLLDMNTGTFAAYCAVLHPDQSGERMDAAQAVGVLMLEFRSESVPQIRHMATAVKRLAEVMSQPFLMITAELQSTIDLPPPSSKPSSLSVGRASSTPQTAPASQSAAAPAPASAGGAPSSSAALAGQAERDEGLSGPSRDHGAASGGSQAPAQQTGAGMEGLHHRPTRGRAGESSAPPNSPPGDAAAAGSSSSGSTPYHSPRGSPAGEPGHEKQTAYLKLNTRRHRLLLTFHSARTEQLYKAWMAALLLKVDVIVRLLQCATFVLTCIQTRKLDGSAIAALMSHRVGYMLAYVRSLLVAVLILAFPAWYKAHRELLLCIQALAFPADIVLLTGLCRTMTEASSAQSLRQFMYVLRLTMYENIWQETLLLPVCMMAQHTRVLGEQVRFHTAVLRGSGMWAFSVLAARQVVQAPAAVAAGWSGQSWVLLAALAGITAGSLALGWVMDCALRRRFAALQGSHLAG